MIVIDHVSKLDRTGRAVTEALREVSITIRDGEFIAIVGPSGCGKTTLLHLLAGFERPDRGAVLIGSTPVAGPGRDRAVVFQQAGLYPWLKVLDNITFSLKLQGERPKRRKPSWRLIWRSWGSKGLPITLRMSSPGDAATGGDRAGAHHRTADPAHG